jgi:hypothetical protein
MAFLWVDRYFLFFMVSYSSDSASALDSGTNGTVCGWEGEFEKGSHGCKIQYEFKMFIYLLCLCVRWLLISLQYFISFFKGF